MAAAALTALPMAAPPPILEPFVKAKHAKEIRAYIKAHEESVFKSQQLTVMSPSVGVQKERMVVEDYMHLIFSAGSVVSAHLSKNCPRKPPKFTDSAPLFMKAERYHSLFDAAIKLHQLGLDWLAPSSNHHVKKAWGGDRRMYKIVKAEAQNGNCGPGPLPRCIVLDIEGTTTPISFVTDVLFPFARDNVRKHLTETYDTQETKDDIKLLRAQVEDDLKQGIVGAMPIPPDDAGKEEVISGLVANVEAMISADRKIMALKQLQGHIWRTGFQSNELEGKVYEDVAEALAKWHASGIKVYIYSSGSREAQRLIFGNTNFGDLRKYLCGFFDTTIGNKRDARSYFEISQSVGVDKPSEILFLTDVLPEALAAKEAGLEVIISIRPGNAPLEENHGFKTIRSFSEIY